MDGKRAAILNNNVANLSKDLSFFEPEYLQCHVTDEPLRHRTGEISKAGLGHLVIEGLVGDGRAEEGIEATVEVGDRLDPLAGTGRRQSQAQTKWGDGPLPMAKPHVFATGIEQRFGKDPLEVVRDPSGPPFVVSKTTCTRGVSDGSQ